jgi:hypothetical protein
MSGTSDSHPISHQTVRIGRGSHPGPSEGACVMELSSMLAGERFSDHPKSVCRVIASFLRAYNDAVDDRRRQDLYSCAAAVVGTRSSRATERARLARCERELAELRGAAAPGWRRRLAHGLRCLDPSCHATRLFAELARTLSTDEREHDRALALVDELVSIRRPAGAAVPADVRRRGPAGAGADAVPLSSIGAGWPSGRARRPSRRPPLGRARRSSR